MENRNNRLNQQKEMMINAPTPEMEENLQKKMLHDVKTILEKQPQSLAMIGISQSEITGMCIIKGLQDNIGMLRELHKLQQHLENVITKKIQEMKGDNNG